MRRAAAFILPLCLLPAVALADGADGALEALMARLHAVKAASAWFVEFKDVHLVTKRLESSGTLAYQAPDRLERVTQKPAPESMLLQGHTLSGRRSNGDRYSVDIDDHPEVAALVEGIRSTLAGDLPTLRRYYNVAFGGSDDSWILTLTPRDSRVHDKVTEIRITGAAALLRTIQVQESDGDHSEMIITEDQP